MNALTDRIAALRRDIAQAERDKRLEARWRRELTDALGEVAHQQQHLDHSRPVPRDGIDYAWGRPTPGEIVRSGARFAVRYLGGSPSKDIDRAEAENLSHAGLELVVVWEAGGEAARGGYQAGSRDAKAASRQAEQVGLPKGRPIYFAVDYDAQGRELEAVAQYVRGAHDVRGWGAVGVYGGIAVVNHVAAANLCRFYWQTLAWSGGAWSAHAQLRQIQVSRMIGGVEVDIDRAVAADFGQWRV